jgi:hypothetical protein
MSFLSGSLYKKKSNLIKYFYRFDLPSQVAVKNIAANLTSVKNLQQSKFCAKKMQIKLARS